MREGRFDVVVSWDLVDEVVRVLRRPRLRKAYLISEDDIRDLLVLLSPALPQVEVSAPLRDPNDAPVVAAAVIGNADAIATGDSDLLDDVTLREWLSARRIDVLRPVDFVRSLNLR